MESPEFFETSFYHAQHTPDKRLPDPKTGDHFIIDDLLDLPNDETMVAADGCLDAAMVGTSTESSSATPVDTSCNSSFSTVEPAHFLAADIVGTRSLADGHFSSELCVPYDDLAELEWLSNFVEESFSSEDLQKMQLIQGVKARTNEAFETHQYQFQPEASRPGPMLRSEMSVPAKARSKRSRAAPGNWTSRLLVVSPTPAPADVPAMSSSSESDVATTAGKKSAKPAGQKKRKCPRVQQVARGGSACIAPPTRRHSGGPGPWARRPFAMPVGKVLELRRQKEMLRTQQQQQQFLHHHHHHHHHHQSMMFDVSNSDDYLINQHIGPDFRQLI
ncbi:UNVERIFIED_CONTAM: GATA transcription factor 9 [Sesamum radiatum]|uniref:GATA transcription factor 9 n=1 Tax=Sesamum radiatum TaxID=300843 RepID=A0AAW2L122_SESRA